MDQRRGRVLVVDDEPRMARVLRRALAPEHDVIALTSAAEALAVVAAGEGFDLILCDLVMPGMDGMVFYERVRSIAPGLTEHFVIMTGGAFTLRAKAFLNAVAVPRLDKPFALDELRRVVREHLGRRFLPEAARRRKEGEP